MLFSPLNCKIGNNWPATCKKKINLDIGLTPHKINSKWVTDLNGKHKTIKILEDKTGENLDDLGFGYDFLHTTPKAWSRKERIEKLDFIRI